MTRGEAAQYLAALIDGEGCVYVSPHGGMHVTVVNTESELIDAAAECCDLLGIGYRRTERNYVGGRGARIAYYLRVGRRADLEELQRLVPIRSRRKQERFETGLASYTQPWDYADQTEIDEAKELRAQGWAYAAIAARMGRSTPWAFRHTQDGTRLGVRRISNAPLREAFLASGQSAYVVAARIGWLRRARNRSGAKLETRQPDGSRVERSLGLREYVSRGERLAMDRIEVGLAARIADAIGVDPIEVGL